LLCCITDNGNEFLGTEFQDLLRSYGVQPIHTTIKNPQANCNMIRTYEFKNFEFDYNDPWSQILTNCARAIRSVAHSILDATPAQILFERDMLFDLSFMTNYSELENKKQKASDLNVDHENTKRIKYDYKVDDLILLDCGTLQRKPVPKPSH
jgi:hypothetical protein